MKNIDECCMMYDYSLQQVLTALQQQQLDKLSTWLTIMESQLYECTRQGVGTNRVSLQQQHEKHKVCVCFTLGLTCY